MKQVHVVRRANPDTPADAPPLPGDIIHVELDSGYVHAVDPVTRLATVRRQEFEIVSPLGNFLVKDAAPPVARDPEVGISIRFVKQYDIETDRLPTRQTIEFDRRVHAMLRRPPPWWRRLGFWLYWTFYDHWRDRDDCE